MKSKITVHYGDGLQVVFTGPGVIEVADIAQVSVLTRISDQLAVMNDRLMKIHEVNLILANEATRKRRKA